MAHHPAGPFTSNYLSNDELSVIADAFQLCLAEGSNTVLVADMIETLQLCCDQQEQPQQQDQPNIFLMLLDIFQHLPPDQTAITLEMLFELLESRLDAQTSIFTESDLSTIFKLLSLNQSHITVHSLYSATQQFCGQSDIQQVAEMLQTAMSLQRLNPLDESQPSQHRQQFSLDFDSFVNIVKHSSQGLHAPQQLNINSSINDTQH